MKYDIDLQDKAESIVVGSCLNDNDLIDKAVSRGVCVEWFVNLSYSELWKGICEHHENHKRTDILWAMQYVKEQTGKEQTLNSEKYTEIQFNSAVDIMKRRYGREQILKLLSNVDTTLYNRNPVDVLTVLSQQADDLRKTVSTPVQPIDKDKIFEQLAEDINRGIDVSTGYSTLDWLFRGVRGGALHIVGGYTHHGKSLYLQNIAYNIAEKGHHVTVFSTEMMPKDYYNRFTIMRAHCNPLIHINPTPEMKDKYTRAIPATKDLPIDVYMESSLAVIRDMIREKKSMLYLIDHLQPVEPGCEFQAERDRLGYVVRAFEVMSKEYDVCIMISSHFNRPSKEEQRQQKRPSAYAYYGSGQIEQNADIGIKLFYPYKDADHKGQEQMEKNQEDCIINVDVWKNRLFGLSKIVKMRLDKDSLRLWEIKDDKETEQPFD